MTVFAEHTIEAAGVRLFVREAGAGDPVVLLHGFPQTGECWRGVASRLAPRFRVIVPDLPGFGRSEAPPAYDAATVAGLLAEFLEAADATGATVVGHDWGGSFAFRLALAHPKSIERLVVTNAPFRKLDLKRGFHFVAFNIPVLPELLFRVAGDRVVPFVLRAASARKEAFAGDAVKPYVEAYRDPENVSSALAYYRTVTRRAIAGMVRRRPAGGSGSSRRIQAPTLIVWGMRDFALPAAVLESIERDIPHARVVRLDEVGHFVPDEAPEELARAIESFIDND